MRREGSRARRARPSRRRRRRSQKSVATTRPPRSNRPLAAGAIAAAPSERSPHRLGDEAILLRKVGVRRELHRGHREAVADGDAFDVDGQPDAELLGAVDAVRDGGRVVALRAGGKGGRVEGAFAGSARALLASPPSPWRGRIGPYLSRAAQPPPVALLPPLLLSPLSLTAYDSPVT